MGKLKVNQDKITNIDEVIKICPFGAMENNNGKGIFYGEKGYIVVDNINNPKALDVFDCNDNLVKHMDVPAQITGYEYEIMESMDMIRQGKLESESMPLSETLFIMNIMDDLRQQWGIMYLSECH